MICNVLDYLERAGEKHPHKVVFSDPLHEITYRECISTAKSIGTKIAEKKAVRRAVAVLIDRDVESLEIFMGSVYSGNFYVPLNKRLPVNRIRQILENVKPICLVCREADLKFISSLDYEGEVLVFEKIADTPVDEKLLADIRKGHLDTDPLYAIYTSGSTGTPKGVLVCHRSVIDLVEQFAGVFHFTQDEVFGNQAPFDFDVSVKDIYSTLRNGASMCIVTQRMISFPRELVAYLNERRVTTVIWAVSALALCASFKGLDREIPRYLKKIMFSGEVMPIKVLNYWREKLPNAMYVNLYGPTEITCNCCYYIVDREFSMNETLPLGEAFPNTEVFLLNDRNQRAEEGETGEICVRGTSLALGYYRNFETTVRVFCQNPLNQDYPELIYRTGDMGRISHGEMYYVTRMDYQIKHMGHRIELGEIEMILDRLEYISRSCCIYDSEHEKICMFYEAKEPCDRQIIKDIREYLPKYMCPNRYVYLKQLPLNKNGKLDRTKLKEEYIGRS